MMTYIYVLRNKKMGVFTFPFNAPYPPKDMAEIYRRQILEGKTKPEQAEEMTLYEIGTYEDQDCTIKLYPQSQFICELADFLPKKEIEENGECANIKQA